MTVPVTIRSKSTGTASTAAPSEVYEKTQAKGPYDDEDLDPDFDFALHKPSSSLRKPSGGSGSGSDSFDSYDPHHTLTDKHGHHDTSSGESGRGVYDHHLSAVIRKHTRSSLKKPRNRQPGTGKSQRKQRARETASKPFK